MQPIFDDARSEAWYMWSMAASGRCGVHGLILRAANCKPPDPGPLHGHVELRVRMHKLVSRHQFSIPLAEKIIGTRTCNDHVALTLRQVGVHGVLHIQRTVDAVNAGCRYRIYLVGVTSVIDIKLKNLQRLVNTEIPIDAEHFAEREPRQTSKPPSVPRS